jgi:hypothetical protein
VEGGTWKRGRAAFAVVLLLSLIFTAFVLFDISTEEADAILPISVQYNFASEQEHRTGNLVEIQTGPGEDGAVRVAGTIEFYRSAKLLRTRVFIELHFKSDHPEVFGSVFPPIIEIDPMAKLSHYPITVNIQISPMTKYSTGVSPLVEVTVWGTWWAKYQDGNSTPFATGDVPEYPLYVNVRPYHYLQMTFDPVMIELSPGSSDWVRCIVQNSGNGYERVELSIPGEVAYAKAGWVFEFEDTVLDIGPDSESSTRIKITAPRTIEPKYHMEMYDFSVLAVSHYSNYQVKDGHLFAPIEYESGVFIQVNGIDFMYVPWMWTITLYLAMAFILFNLGINPLVMKRRKVEEPGFIKIYHLASNPKRRAKAMERREERRKLRREEREQRRSEKELLKEEMAKERKTTSPKKEKVKISEEPIKKRAPILDLKRTDDDFDIEIPGLKEEKQPKPESKSKPLLGGGRKRDKVEKDMVDILGSLDD